MPFVLIIFLFCLIFRIVYLIYTKQKERKLIEQVTSILEENGQNVE